MPNKRGIGCGCCFDCNTDDCCDGDVFPDELEVTIPDVFTTGNTGLLGTSHTLTVTCDACGSIGGVYVLTHLGGGAYEYDDNPICTVTTRYILHSWDCDWTVRLRITAGFACYVPTKQCSLLVQVTVAISQNIGTPIGGPFCLTATQTFTSFQEVTTWWLLQSSSFGDCTSQSWTVPWYGFQDAFGGDNDTTPSLCTSAGSGSDVTVDQV